MQVVVSIIMVCKGNVEEFVTTVAELKRHEYIKYRQQLQVLVIDSSKQAEAKQIADVCAKNGFEYFWTEPRGIYPAMNVGIDRSMGEWLWFLNPGDLPTLCAADLINSLVNVTSDTVLFKTKVVDALDNFQFFRNEEISKKVWRAAYALDYCHQGILYNRSVFESGERYEVRYKLISDKILNDKYIGKNTYISKLQLATFKQGGRSADTMTVRKELLHYLIYNYFKITLKRIIGNN